MPLSKEGVINVSQRQRESDQRIRTLYGTEQLKENLDREGVYAYSFSTEASCNRAVEVLFELSEEYLYGDPKLRERYFGVLGDRRRFGYESHSLAFKRKALIIKKPFPREEYEWRLVDVDIPFKTMIVHRLANLTEPQINNYFRRGSFILWFSNCIIDLRQSKNR